MLPPINSSQITRLLESAEPETILLKFYKPVSGSGKIQGLELFSSAYIRPMYTSYIAN